MSSSILRRKGRNSRQGAEKILRRFSPECRFTPPPTCVSSRALQLPCCALGVRLARVGARPSAHPRKALNEREALLFANPSSLTQDLKSWASTGKALNKREAFAQINSFYLRIVPQLFGRASAEDSSFVNNVGPIRDGERFPDIMVGYQDPDPRCLQIKNNLLQIQHGDGINA